MNSNTHPEKHYYAVYGLNLVSAIRLPDLTPSGTGSDASVVVQAFSRDKAIAEMSSPERFDRENCVVHMSPDAALYDWEGLARALVRNGREIILDPAPGINAEDLSPLVVGALLGILLTHRGHLVLHGSFVRVNGNGFGFLGEKGMGKSTLAAYLTSAGHELVTDDLLPVSTDGERVVTKPGYPRIRLWPDSFARLGIGRDKAEESSRLIPKGAVKPEKFAGTEEIGVDALFILDHGDEVALELLPQTNALVELIRNTYLNRYLNATRRTGENFRRCEEVVKGIPVFKLKRPSNYEFLPSVAHLLEEFRTPRRSRALD